MSGMALRGRLSLLVCQRGRIIERWSDSNVLTLAGKAMAARLLAGAEGAQPVTHVGVGISGAQATPDDVALTDPFVKPLSGASFPAPRQVRFHFTVDSGEAVGMNIAEFGLLHADGTLWARRARTPITKEADMALFGEWDILVLE